MKAMLLAAGRGQRLRPRTDNVPKALIKVCGQTLIERHLFRLSEAGCIDIVINLGWLGALIPEKLGDGRRYGLSITYSEEGWPSLDTGGGIRHALPSLGSDPFLVVNADVWTDYPLSSLVQCARTLASRDTVHLVMVPNPPHHAQGDFGFSAGRIVSANPHFTYSGLSVLRPTLFDDSPDGSFPIVKLWRQAVAEGRASGEFYDGIWCDVGTEQRLRLLKSRLARYAWQGKAAHTGV